MSYDYWLNGSFDITPHLAENHRAYLEAFSQTRHVKRDVSILADLPDPLRVDVGLPIGDDGEFFVGQIPIPTILKEVNQDQQPGEQPSLWCMWAPWGQAPNQNSELISEDAEVDGKFEEWLNYLIKHFLGPWGYTLNGIVDYSGEESHDTGCIRVDNNVVRVAQDIVTNPLRAGEV